MINLKAFQRVFWGALLLAVSGLVQAADEDWALTLYGATLSADGIEDVLGFNADYEDDYQLVALALSYRLPQRFESIDLEWENQLVKHTEGQDHYELNTLLSARWKPFPWDHIVDTNLAFGVGLSYADELPQFEADNHDEADQFLGYLLVELELAPPGDSPWSAVVRVHHRSGAFGLFNDVEGASNALGLGLKYRF
ncbi:hypothetical protein [Marinobacterium arenosum]|uniref:hypothetical protein n=1 Tax=Marinobacterium arenosum TaxID=2862496 RepID=UPI001C972432|nr:hypothetical protein [Marinobacterium arenosum]MBY4678935.1 hypothetical protein [Marinobacterium arenosum]